MTTLEMMVDRYTGAWRATFSLLKRPTLFVPFVVIGILEMVPVVLAHYYWHPSVSGFMAPALQSLFGEEALHFPEHILRLPMVQQVVNITVMVVVGFVMIGWAVLMMADALEGTAPNPGRCIGTALVRVPSLLLIGVVFVGCVVGLPILASAIGGLTARPRLQLLLSVGGLAIGLWFKGVLIYSPFFLVSSGANAVGAMRRSVEYARTWPALTAMVILTAWLVHFPLEYLIAHPAILLAGPGPDSIFVVLVLKTIVEIFTLFYLFAATTFITVKRMEPW